VPGEEFVERPSLRWTEVVIFGGKMDIVDPVAVPVETIDIADERVTDFRKIGRLVMSNRRAGNPAKGTGRVAPVGD